MPWEIIKLSAEAEEIVKDEMKKKKEIIRTEKGKAELERSKKAEELRKQSKTVDMFKTMFGQDL